MNAIERVKATYRRFADDECRGYSDHYFNLSHEIANDDLIASFISNMPVIQPNLFLAAIQYLTGPEAMPRSSVEVRALLRAHREAVTHLMQTRRTQTNEPGRCATILPALPRTPLALIEVGASAGLCLLLDKYAYEYGDLRLGPTTSPVRVHCEVTGSPPLVDPMPEIVWRAGLDIHPLSVHEEDDVQWLSSLVWPEHRDRRKTATGRDRAR